MLTRSARLPVPRLFTHHGISHTCEYSSLSLFLSSLDVPKTRNVTSTTHITVLKDENANACSHIVTRSRVKTPIVFPHCLLTSMLISGLRQGAWRTLELQLPKTGNFIFILAGDVPNDLLYSYKKWLCAPFPGSDIVPNKGWTWAQLRGVPTMNAERCVQEAQDLLREARTNAVINCAFICVPPHWQPPQRRYTQRQGQSS